MTAAVVRAGTEKLGYRPELDGLRALAIVGVLLGHTGWWWAYGGCLGVDLFFVLSGFLITTILLEEMDATGRVRLGRFYERRARRLVPCLVAVVAFCWVALPVLQPATRGGLVPALLYVGNWARAGGADLGSLDHTWSLAIEEQFYLVWPVVVIAAARIGRGRMAQVCVGLAVTVAAVRIFGGFSAERAHNGTDLHSDVLLAGAALAYARSAGWWSMPKRRLRVPAPLVWLGQRSYGLYLWHFPIGHIIGRPVASFAVALLVTECSYRWIEAPFRRSRDLRAPEVDAVGGGSGVDARAVVMPDHELHVVAG